MPRNVRATRQPPSVSVWWRGLLGAVLLFVGLVVALAPGAQAQEQSGPVYTVSIHGEIDLGLAPYLSRVLDTAERENASAVILDVNTPGGRLDAALTMRQALLDAPVRTIAFVNRDAFSAGALIALAAEEIYMAPGAVLGAATPVTGAGEPASPKTISAVRSTFRSTAELRGRDPRLAEAMVDPSIAVAGLDESDQLLTLTTTSARAWGYADGEAASRADLLQAAGLAGLPVRETAPALAEELVRIITHPAVASLLMTVGLLLILGEFFAGTGGLLAGLGAGLMALFFWGHMLAGLAGWEGVALVGLGVGLLALEAFVIPGFGIAGILGIAAFGTGLFISVVGGEIVTEADLVRATYTVAGTLLVSIVAGIGAAWLLVRTGASSGLVLKARLGTLDTPPRWPLVHGSAGSERELPATSGHVESAPDARMGPLTGARGVAISDLRPGGYARVDGRRVDVVTQGEYLPSGTILEVLRDEGYRRVVRQCEPAQGRAHRPSSTVRA